MIIICTGVCAASVFHVCSHEDVCVDLGARWHAPRLCAHQSCMEEKPEVI